ncbi:hypothetical protein K2Y11_23100 [bacterium]|nr:hypothetical protein [bacterium]
MTLLANLESLEDRTVSAVVLWDGVAGTTNWQDALNWSTDALPGTTDDVRILEPGSTVNLSSGFANVASVFNDR